MIKRINLSLDRATICHQILIQNELDRKLIDEYVLEVQDQMMFSCYKDEILVGYIAAVTTNFYSMEVKSIGVSPLFHRKKCGTMLVDAIIDYARKNEFKIMMVKVESKNTNLRKFFEHVNFIPLDQVNSKMIYVLPV